MNDNDVRQTIYGAILGLLIVVGIMVSVAYISSCGLTLSCNRAAPFVDRTPVPTLVPATFAAVRSVALQPTATPDEASANVLRPSNAGGPGAAVDLTGNVESGKQIFVDNCQRCHGPEGTEGLPNSGTVAGTVPALNPINKALVNSDYKTFATNLDLFIEHGSTPAGTVPNFSMPAWGDSGALKPQQIADVIAYIISLNQK